MNKRQFSEVLESVQQACGIVRGQRRPSREVKVDVQRTQIARLKKGTADQRSDFGDVLKKDGQTDLLADFRPG